MAEREFRMILPKRDNLGHPINVQLLQGIVQEVADHFGGVTVLPVTLGCFDPGGGRPLECEEGLMVDVTRFQDQEGRPASPGLIQQDQAWMADLASRVAVQLGQQSVFEQQELDTRTDYRPGRRLAELPPALLQTGPLPATLFGRLIRPAG